MGENYAPQKSSTPFVNPTAPTPQDPGNQEKRRKRSGKPATGLPAEEGKTGTSAQPKPPNPPGEAADGKGPREEKHQGPQRHERGGGAAFLWQAARPPPVGQRGPKPSEIAAGAGPCSAGRPPPAKLSTACPSGWSLQHFI